MESGGDTKLHDYLKRISMLLGLLNIKRYKNGIVRTRYGMHAADIGDMLWALMRPTCRCVMGIDTVASVPVQYGKPSLASPGFWLKRGMVILVVLLVLNA